MTDYPPPPPPPPPPYGVGGYSPMGAVPPPNNNLALAIVATVLCCLPVGIYAIVKAAEVNTKWAMGDTAGAFESAAQAKKFAIISAVAAAVGATLYFLVIIGLAATSSTSGY